MSKKKSLPPAVWVALGLTACKDVVGPCLDIAPIDTGPCLDIPQDTAPDSDADTDADTDSDTDTDTDTDIGPCLDIPADSGFDTDTDTGVGPCLDIAPETGVADTASDSTADTGSVSSQSAKGPAGKGLREQLLQQLVDQGIFAPDTVARLLGEDGGADAD